MFELIGVAAGVLAAASYVPYVSDILRRKVKPERASWLIWVVLAAIAFFSQYAKGATDSLWFTGLDSVGAAVIFGLAVTYGVGGVTRRDLGALIAAGAGLLLWAVTRDAVWALLIIILVDSIGTALTVVKTYEDPSSETYAMWVMVCVAGVFAILAVGTFNVVLLAYPTYIFLANLSVVLAKYWASSRNSRVERHYRNNV